MKASPWNTPPLACASLAALLALAAAPVAAEETAPSEPAPQAADAPAAPAPPQAAPQSPAPQSPAPAALPADVEKRLKELEETTRRQQELIRKLEETVEALKKTPAAAAPAQPGAQPGGQPGGQPTAQKPTGPPPPPGAIIIRGADGVSNLRIRGLLQMDTRAFPFNEGRSGNENLLMRRVRPVFMGNIGRYTEFMFQPAFDEGRASLFDAFFDVREGRQLQFRAGKFKVPFSLERLQAAQDLVFVERSIAQNLAPNRDVGVQIHGENLQGRLSYAAGVFNGSPDTGNIDGDLGREKDFAGRVFAQPFLGKKGHPLEGLGLGIAGTWGSRNEPFTVSFRSADRTPFFLYRNGTLFEGEVQRLAPQLHYYYGSFGLMGEGYITREDVRLGPNVRTMNNNGWFVQASYVLTGEKTGFRNPTPRRPFNPSRGHWGAVEVAARYSQFRADEDAFRLGFADPLLAAGVADAWTIGLNWYLNTNLKFQVNYERTDFGSPIQVGERLLDREDVVLTRLQLAF